MKETGHWIEKDEKSAVCSCCNRNNTLYGDFCKWCGAKMIESQECEDKDTPLDNLRAEIKQYITHSPYITGFTNCCRLRDDVMRIIDKYKED